jgi:putative ABC transport system permease protein
MSMRRVPLARRNLFQDRRRAGLAVAGLAVAMLLVLVLDGIFAGAIRQVTAYLRSLSADAIVAQQGVRTMHMSASALPEDTADQIARFPGVASADGIRFTSGTLHANNRSQLSYVIGYDTATGRGGPWDLVRGRTPRRGEVVLDQIGADNLGVGLGDAVTILGREFIVSGLGRGGTSITNTTAFVPTEDFRSIRGPSLSYVLVEGRAGTSASDLQRRLARLPGVTVQTKDEFVAQERRIVRDMSADIMQIMSIIAFLIALAVVALTLFTATLSKLREYAVVKALGASSLRLGGAIAAQAVWSIGLALVTAVLLAGAATLAVGSLTANVRLAIEPASVVRVGAAALLAGAIGALVPLRRLLRLDPATAFKG